MKAIILVGGPQKGTRFRPLSLEVPKPLFPIGDIPMVEHHVEACATVPGMQEILLIGFYPESSFQSCIHGVQKKFPKISIRYLREYQSLGTAGGLYHFRDQILKGNPSHFFVLNADICCSFPLQQMLDAHNKLASSADHFTMMSCRLRETSNSNQYGQIVVNEATSEVMHYAEKPETLVSSTINCGVYVFTPKLFDYIGAVFLKRHSASYMDLSDSAGGMGMGMGGDGGDEDEAMRDIIMLETDVLSQLAGTHVLFAFATDEFWMQVKSAGSALQASCLYLEQYRKTAPTRLASSADGGPQIVGNVVIDATANVAPTAKLGPNVTIGPNVTVGYGVRVSNSLVLAGAQLKENCCIRYSIVGWNNVVGAWARVEGSPEKEGGMGGQFVGGTKSPGITILGDDVKVKPEIMVLNCISLPHKEVKETTKNAILL